MQKAFPSLHSCATFRTSSEDTGGIAYFGYAYYATFTGQLTVARIASDAYKGVKERDRVRVGRVARGSSCSVLSGPLR